jgi:hypothetical protein
VASISPNSQGVILNWRGLFRRWAQPSHGRRYGTDTHGSFLAQLQQARFTNGYRGDVQSRLMPTSGARSHAGLRLSPG